MAQGKFSNPRPHRDEERQIEEAFRQVTQQQSSPRRRKQAVTEEEQMNQVFRQAVRQEPVTRQLDLSELNAAEQAIQQEAATEQTFQQEMAPQPTMQEEDAQIEQAFREVTGQPAAKPASTPKKPAFDRIQENVANFFEDEDIPYEEEPPAEETEPDFMDSLQAFFHKAVDFCSKNQKIVMIGLCAIAVALIGLFMGIFFAGSSDPYGNKILSNVSIADIHVGGMTKDEATNAVKQATSNTYTRQDMVIDLSGVELRLSPKDTDAKLDVKAAVSAAYDYGRTGTQAERDAAYRASLTEQYVIGLLPYLDLDEDYILDTLTTYAEDTGSTLTQTAYGLEGEEPELSADKFDENTPCQTLVITMGTPGIGFDVNDVYNQVLDAYSLHQFLVTVENIESVKEPDPIDLEAIYKEFYIAPVDASVNMQSFETIPGSYGYGFDLEEAQKLIDKAEFGETVRIPMEYIEPEILDGGTFFKDVLGEYQTRHTSNENRTTNLRLACEAIDGTVLMPGESLSFSSQLGKVRGYKSAPEDTGREDTAQGGVSQVASTLYYAAMMSDLEIVSRNNLGFVPSFIDPGMDAAPSLTIRNSLGYPIRIDAQVSGGYVKIEIVGTEERDYYIMLDYTFANTYQPETEYEDFEYNNAEGYLDGDVLIEGTTGYLVKTYKIKYSTETGKQISRDFIANSQYPVTNRLVARVEKPVETTPPTEAPKPTETVKPTETTAPTETTPASSETAAPSENTDAASDNTKSTEAAVTAALDGQQEQLISYAESSEEEPSAE